MKPKEHLLWYISNKLDLTAQTTYAVIECKAYFRGEDRDDAEILKATDQRIDWSIEELEKEVRALRDGFFKASCDVCSA